MQKEPPPHTRAVGLMHRSGIHWLGRRAMSIPHMRKHEPPRDRPRLSVTRLPSDRQLVSDPPTRPPVGAHLARRGPTAPRARGPAPSRAGLQFSTFPFIHVRGCRKPILPHRGRRAGRRKHAAGRPSGTARSERPDAHIMSCGTGVNLEPSAFHIREAGMALAHAIPHCNACRRAAVHLPGPA